MDKNTILSEPSYRNRDTACSSFQVPRLLLFLWRTGWTLLEFRLCWKLGPLGLLWGLVYGLREGFALSSPAQMFLVCATGKTRSTLLRQLCGGKCGCRTGMYPDVHLYGASPAASSLSGHMTGKYRALSVYPKFLGLPAKRSRIQKVGT